jgi:acyl carrier protein
VREALVEVLSEIQALRGEEETDIGDETCPMEDLAGFDSLGAIEATTQLSERLSQELDPKLFFRKDDTPLRVTEIVDRVCQTIDAGEGGSRG